VWDLQSPYRATAAEQADYLIQGTAFALFAGADAIFPFQLYDGCGNQPQGTDFPPHNGEYCTENPDAICAGDAYGLFSNPTDASCFRQHPTPESPRPQFHALPVLTTHMKNVSPLFRVRPYGTDETNGPQEWLGFFRHDTQKRIAVMWSRVDADGDGQVAEMPASDTHALLIFPDGTTTPITPTNGIYTIDLAPATNDNIPRDPADPPPALRAIGGSPVILIEGDTKPPVVTAGGHRVGETIHMGWEGIDNYLGTDIADYTVQVSVEGAPAVTWLSQTTDVTQIYPNADLAKSYRFLITTRDQAGNASEPYEVEFQPIIFTEHVYLPMITR
jgi:hypothetical protein